MMDKTTKKTFTMQGRDTPVSVGDVGARAGPARSSTSNCPGSPVSSLAGTLDIITGVQNETDDRKEDPPTDVGWDDPFKRRESLPRSPPRGSHLAKERDRHEMDRRRSGSCSRIVDDMAEGKASKRKREEGTEKSSNMREMQEYFDLIQKLNEDVNSLNKEVEGTYKPKTKIKNLAISIALWAKELEKQAQNAVNRGPQNLLNERANEMEDKDTHKFLREENQKLHAKIREMEGRHQKEMEERTLTTSGVRCEECRRAERIEARRRTLTNERNFEGFQKVTDEDWEDEVFPKIRVKYGDIWDTQTDMELILPCNKNIDAVDKAVGRAIDKFGGIDGLKKQNKAKGEVAMMRHSIGFPDSDGNYTHISRGIYYPILSDGGTTEEVDDRNVFLSLQTIKKHIMTQVKTKVAIPEKAGITGITMVRMLEFLFVGTNVDITMYKPRDTYSRVTGTKSPRKGRTSAQTGGANADTRAKILRQDAILIRMEGKRYVDMLKTVRETLNPSEIGVDIKDISKDKEKKRSGELLLTVQNGKEKAEVLKREIREKIPEARTSLLINKKVLHIKDLDEVVTEEEIRETITKSTWIWRYEP